MRKKFFLFLFLLLFLPLAAASQTIAPEARIFDLSGKQIKSFGLFDSDYSGGLELALGDINNDGKSEILVCPASGHEPQVKAYDSGGKILEDYLAFGNNFRGGCFIAAANVNNFDGDETIVGTGYGGGPHIKVFKYGLEQSGFFGFGQALRTGVRVAAADLGADGQAEIIAFSNINYPAEYVIFGADGHKISSKKIPEINSNGLSLAIGDFNDDGNKELAVAGGYGNEPIVFIFDSGGQLTDKIIYSQGDYRGGLNLAAGDINNDKKDEIIVTESFDGSDLVSTYNRSGQVVQKFNAYGGEKFYNGLKAAVGDVNGDGKKEIVVVPERLGKLKSEAYKFVAIDLSQQTLYRYQNGSLLDSYLISSGKSGTPTPTGDFKIYLKRPKVRMSWYYGPSSPMNYDLPNVPWVASFKGLYTIHGTYWHHNFGHPMSHGCVNMRTPEAKIVYDWVDIGTPVVIY